jgi:hypothetical protein
LSGNALHELARAGLLETFGRGLVGLKFSHIYLAFSLQLLAFSRSSFD